MKSHFENYRQEFEQTVNRIEEDMHIDDLVTGENTVDEVTSVKKESVVLF